MNGREYTWGNNLEHPTFEKLDRILCCTDWEENYPLVTVEALYREKSDHVPLYICTGDLPRNDPLFKFENSWLMREVLTN